MEACSKAWIAWTTGFGRRPWCQGRLRRRV